MMSSQANKTKRTLYSLDTMMSPQAKKLRFTAPKDRVVKALAKRLMESSFNFKDKNLALSFAKNGVAKTLLKLEKQGFKISEHNPLLIMNIDTVNPDSIGYFNQGNYGVATGATGHLAGPIPHNEE
jgi:hypothetical protein